MVKDRTTQNFIFQLCSITHPRGTLISVNNLVTNLSVIMVTTKDCGAFPKRNKIPKNTIRSLIQRKFLGCMKARNTRASPRGPDTEVSFF